MKRDHADREELSDAPEFLADASTPPTKEADDQSEAASSASNTDPGKVRATSASAALAVGLPNAKRAEEAGRPSTQGSVSEPDSHGPDLSFLNTSIRSAAPFPLDVLSDDVRGLIVGMAQGQHTHPAFLTTSAFSTIAGAVGTSAYLRVNGDWREPCSIWSLLVGGSGTGKSVAMRNTVGVLTEIGIAEFGRMAPDPSKEGVDKLVQAEMQRRIRRRIAEGLDRDETDFSSYTFPQKTNAVPQLQTCTSTTLPAILTRLQDHPRGLLLTQPDIMGLTGSATLRSDEGRAALLQGFDGDPYIRERATGAQILPTLLLSVCGGVTPDKLAHVIGQDDDGLYGRCLVAYPHVSRDTEFRSRTSESSKGFERVLRHVLACPAAPTAFGGHSVTVSEHAWRAFGPAFRRWASEGDEHTGMLASTYNRAPTQALRLSLVLAILEHILAGKAGLPSFVSEACARSAIRLLDEHYLPSAERALDIAQTRPDPDSEIRAIAKFIARKAVGLRFNARELRQARGAPRYRDHVAWAKAVDRLVRLGCIEEAPRRNLTGRSRTDFLAHPSFVAAARTAT